MYNNNIYPVPACLWGIYFVPGNSVGNYKRIRVHRAVSRVYMGRGERKGCFRRLPSSGQSKEYRIVVAFNPGRHPKRL